MKRKWAIILTLLLLLCSTTVYGDDADSWFCEASGNESTGNFCSNCGAKKNDGVFGQANEQVRLDLNIGFEKNAYFSTYDVKLYLDGEWITTMSHGTDFATSLSVATGKHVITFEADSMIYTARGSATINIDQPTLYKCNLQAKMDMILITDEQIGPIIKDQEVAVNKHIVDADGDLELQVNIEFKKNGVFSQYDVDMYCDDIYIATLPHGKNYEGTLLVSKGKHTITFYNAEDKSVRGDCNIKVTKDAYFTCEIKAEKNKVEINKDKLTD